MATSITQDIDLGISRVDTTTGGRIQRAILTIDTSKALRGGLESDATVSWHSEHSRSHAFGLGGGGDFSKKLHRSMQNVKATQKAIDTQHAAVFTPDVVEALVAEAKAYYAEVTK